PASREPVVPVRSRDAPRRARVAPVRWSPRGRGLFQRRVPARSPVVPELSLPGRARAWAGLHRGPGIARCSCLGPHQLARRPDARRGHARGGGGEETEFNSREPSIWIVIGVHVLLAASERAGRRVPPRARKKHLGAVEAILTSYAAGTRYGIRLDRDGLLAAGEPGVQLTWMDAKVGDWVVTPRIGKPVEVEALWLNALRIGGASSARWNEVFERGLRSFGERFWNDSLGCL